MRVRARVDLARINVLECAYAHTEREASHTNDGGTRWSKCIG